MDSKAIHTRIVKISMDSKAIHARIVKLSMDSKTIRSRIVKLSTGNRADQNSIRAVGNFGDENIDYFYVIIISRKIAHKNILRFHLAILK